MLCMARGVPCEVRGGDRKSDVRNQNPKPPPPPAIRLPSPPRRAKSHEPTDCEAARFHPSSLILPPRHPNALPRRSKGLIPQTRGLVFRFRVLIPYQGCLPTGRASALVLDHTAPVLDHTAPVLNHTALVLDHTALVLDHTALVRCAKTVLRRHKMTLSRRKAAL